MKHDLSAAARLGIVFSVIGIAVALLLGTVSEGVQAAVILTTMCVAFASSMLATRHRAEPTVSAPTG